MQENKSDERFWDMVDSFIRLANEYGDQVSIGKVSTALLYAAARYNAFVVVSVDNKNIEGEKPLALEYFGDQYKTMLLENLEDHNDIVEPLPM